MYFQNNKVKITKESYLYVYYYKKQLLKNITKLLDDNNIRFVICYGNLIEYERKKPIYRDDDLDIIFNISDMPQWIKFCKQNNQELKKYNLIFDGRFNDMSRQRQNGVQCRLMKFINPKKIKEFKMDIHCDLVCNIVESEFWHNLDIDFNNLRKIKLYGVNTYAPSKLDTTMILIFQYGTNYIIPNTRNPFKIRSNK